MIKNSVPMNIIFQNNNEYILLVMMIKKPLFTKELAIYA